MDFISFLTGRTLVVKGFVPLDSPLVEWRKEKSSALCVSPPVPRRVDPAAGSFPSSALADLKDPIAGEEENPVSSPMSVSLSVSLGEFGLIAHLAHNGLGTVLLGRTDLVDSVRAAARADEDAIVDARLGRLGRWFDGDGVICHG